ncbi:MAG: 4-hydroxy-tetrahydrodipicolinate reductase [Alphaproteobacteria bacterium]|nr:MAG: 4-hydroxy-tetrahydrodipicolinate reductase [Alphaproteobacteria bacterium]
MAAVRIGVVGCAGRMGRALVSQILDNENAVLSGGTEHHDSPAVGRPLRHPVTGEELDVVVEADANGLFDRSDVVIDFTCPTATLLHADIAQRTGTALVVGTTGFTDDQAQKLRAAGSKIPVVQAANFSLGVNLLLHLTEEVARRLDEDFDIEVLEMHHRHKVDAPSGTALALGEAAARGRGVELARVSDRVRDGITGARKRGHIGFATLRGGNVVGEHTVMFAAENERVELTHKAGDRAIFARGAVTAALWVHGRAPGVYGMADVLGFDG